MRELADDYGWNFFGDILIDDILAWAKEQCGQKHATKNIVEIWKDMRFEVYAQADGNRHEPNYSDNSTKMFSLNDIDEIIEKISEQKLFVIMAKYRIIKREYANGKIDYEVQKKVLGLFWWNFNNIDNVKTGIYDTIEEAKKAIEMNKWKIKETIINIE